jgi:hypothetical protein
LIPEDVFFESRGDLGAMHQLSRIVATAANIKKTGHCGNIMGQWRFVKTTIRDGDHKTGEIILRVP